MDISIIIVNWKSKDYLRKCIASIEAETKGIQFEIIVIDSGSFDGCELMLQKYYPHVRFIQSDRNIGFALANNIAFKESHGRNLLFLNPDTEILGSAIQTLHHHLSSIPYVGIAGAKLLNGDGSVQTTCIRSFPTVLNQVLESDVLRRWFPKSHLWGMAPLLERIEAPCEVNAVSGACLMVKRHVFERVMLFSTEYFMYSEDIDLCLKVRKSGYKTHYVPTAVVLHLGGESSSKSEVSAFSMVMMLESRWRFFKKTKPLWYCCIYRLAILFAGAIRVALAILFQPFDLIYGRASTLQVVLRKWMPRMRWAFGGENWVKTFPIPDNNKKYI